MTDMTVHMKNLGSSEVFMELRSYRLCRCLQGNNNIGFQILRQFALID